MKISLATAKLDAIRWASDNALVDAILTSPALLAEADPDGDAREVLQELCHATALPVWATVGSVSAADIYRDGRDLAKLSDQIVVQIPMVEDAIGAMRRLSAEGVAVAAMFVFNAAQALLAARAGASTVSTTVDQLDAMGDHGVDVLRQIRAVFDADHVPCDVLATHPRNAAQFADCALAGADAVAVSPETLKALLVHPLTDIGVDQFLNELAKHPRARQLS